MKHICSADNGIFCGAIKHIKRVFTLSRNKILRVIVPELTTFGVPFGPFALNVFNMNDLSLQVTNLSTVVCR